MAEMSTLAQSKQSQMFWSEAKKSSTGKPKKLEYKSWEGPNPKPYGRGISIQKAKAACKLYGRAKFPEQGAHFSGHGAQFLQENNLISFASTLAEFFFCRQGSQAREASHWLREARQWQGMPWYKPMLGFLHHRRDRASNRGAPGAIFQETTTKPPMVGAKHQEPRSPGFNKTWCASFLSPTQQAVQGKVHQKSGRNNFGLGNHPGIFRSWCHKGNTFAPGKAFNSLVCDQKRGKVEIDYQLQRNQSVFGAQTIQTRELGRDFSIPKKRYVGSKNRPEACLFSSGNSRSIKTLHLHPNRGKMFSISSSMLWHEHPASTMAECNESFPEKMEKAGSFNLGLFRRHLGSGAFPPHSAKALKHDAARSRTFRHGNQQEEVPTGTNPKSGSFGVFSGFKKWSFAGPTREVESHTKRVGQTFDKQRYVMQKNGSNFGSYKSIFDGNALLKGIHRPISAVCKSTGKPWLGQEIANSRTIERSGQGNWNFNPNLERQKISRKSNSERTTLGLLPRSLGRSRCNLWTNGPGILERKTPPAHQCQGDGSSNKHGPVIGQAWRTCHFKGRQFSDILVSNQRGGEDPQFKPTSSPLLKMVHGEPSNFKHCAGEKFGGFSRWSQQVAQRQRGLYPGQSTFSASFAKNANLQNTTGRHVCLTRQPSIAKICVQAPSLAGLGSKCPEMPFRKHKMLLCKPSLDNNRAMVAQIKAKQRTCLPNHSPLLGFKRMVAPVSETARQGDPSLLNTPIPRDVQELLGRIDASSKMAPSLHMVIRKGLHAKQVSNEAADTFLGDLKSLCRYDKSFKAFWAFCNLKDMDATTATLSEVAGCLLEFEKLMPNHARFAYSSLLLIPGLEQLTFNPLLRALKRKCNSSQPRYFSFYDATDPLRQLAETNLNWSSVPIVRLQLILSLRFLMLCRNIDLARMYRTFSMVGDKAFILVQRKGWKSPQWEALVQVPSVPQIFPWTLLKAYVQLTHQQVQPGTFVFISLHPPYKPLSANCIGSLTRHGLDQLGIDTKIWKPHSTRGAGVTMLKHLGMTSEEVCEVGKWKNVGAFTSHYLRLGASQVLGQKIPFMLHKVSPLSSADPDLTWTTGITDPGGNVREGDAQSNGEPSLPPFDLGGGSPGLSMPLENEPEQDFGHYEMSTGHTGDQALSSPSGPNFSFPVRGIPRKRPRERGWSPPTKFYFSAHKAKEKED